MYGFADLFAILFLLGVFYLLGFRIVRRVGGEESPRSREVDQRVTAGNVEDPLSRQQVLLSALNEPPFTDVLSPIQRERLRKSILYPDDTYVERTPAKEFESAEPVSPPKTLIPDDKPFPQLNTPVQPSKPFGYESSSQEAGPSLSESKVNLTSPPPAVTVPPAKTTKPPSPPRKPVLETIRASWDPAVMMLYLGALLVVVAGLIFATYNWGTLGGWQKLGMLAAATIAFLIAGLAIRNLERVKPAATTFMVIGGLLVPANFLATYTVFDDVQPALPLFFGAVATTVIHGLLSVQPGARIFRYSSAAAGLITVATIPAALGLAAGWGGVLGLVVIAMMPDHLFGLRRFRQAWVIISRSAVGPLAGFSIWQGFGVDGWMIAATLVGVSMVATRFSTRYPIYRHYLLGLADLALIAASVQIAANFDGDRWMLAAGLLALTLVLVQESQRFPVHAPLLELVATFAAALLAGEVVRVLGTEPWAVAIGAGALTALMLLHARRHDHMAYITECMAAAALPISLAAAVYAIDPSLWSAVVGLATLTGTSVWLALRRLYPENWPGVVATFSAIATIVVFAPAIGPDVGWGCLVALIVVAVAPYPFGRMESLSTPWIRFANVLAIPLAALALWRGAEAYDWLVPLTFFALTIWLTRLALEKVFDSMTLLVLADALTVLGTVSTAAVLWDERWLLATGLLTITLVLVKRSRTWPHYAAALEFVAGITLAAFVGDVTRDLVSMEWGIVALASALTVTMLVHARLRPVLATLSEGIATFSLPYAIGFGLDTYNGTEWSLQVGTTVLTLTLIVYGIRHRSLSDLSLAAASFTGIFSVIFAGYLLDTINSDGRWATLFTLLAVALTAIANAVLVRFASVSGWLKNLLRIEGLLVFYPAFLAGDFNHTTVFVVAALAMFWNLWVARQSIWSLPLAFVFFVSWTEIVMPNDPSHVGVLWWNLALAVMWTALAWQLDRRTRLEDEVHAGVYIWPLVTLISAVLVFISLLQMVVSESGIHNGVVLLCTVALHWIGYRSTGFRLFLIPIGLLTIFANIAFLSRAISSAQHIAIAAIAMIIAAGLYWQANRSRIWLGFAALGIGLIHIQLATGFTYSRDLQLGLAFAWILVSLAIVRWRSADTAWQMQPIFLQAMAFHAVSAIVPFLDHTGEITRSDAVLVLVSLAGVVSTFGALRHSRELVLVGSAIGMSSLMLQINIGAPGNLHAYTVPLSIYLLVVGLLLRRDPRIANTLLAIGSGMLVIPAMVEALTTGQITWLWVALAESIGLFLFGNVLRLRIPTATGVIAVSVIALRMLVFAVNIVASWVSILAVGVTLLALGTAWLIFRDAIRTRTQLLFARWQSFD